MYYNSRKEAKKLRWQGILSASLFAILGIITFFDFASGFTNILLGVFGLMFYPMIVLAILISIGFTLNMKFAMSGKNLTYLIMITLSLELLLHTAFVAGFAGEHGVRFSHYFDFLGKVATFESGLTVGGLIASLVAYPIMCILSAVGACIFFAILLTVFVALVVDFYLVEKNSTSNQKVKSMLERNGADEYNYAYTNDSIGGTISNAGKNGNVSIKPSKDRFKNISSNETEESLVEQDEHYTFNSFNESGLDSSDAEANVESTDGGYDFLNDDKANSYYDPSKFSSAEEYIKYPYVPTKFKNKRHSDPVDEENIDDDVAENINEDEEQNFVVNFGDNDEYSSLGDELNEQVDDSSDYSTSNSYDTDEEEENDEFTSGLDSSIFMNTSENARARGRGDSAFDNSPFTRFDVGSENSRGVESSARRGGDEIFANPARSFFESTPRQKDEPEQISLINMEKPKKYKQERDKKYIAPPTTLLELRSDDESSYGGDYQAKSIALEQVLSSFNIDAKVSNVVRGPAVTQYELSMPYGTSVKKILAYDSDIAAALMSRGGVRIEAPILGKNAVGVEVPNDKRSTVGLREMLESKEFQSTSVNLPIVVGKGISGEVVVKSLPKLVHCLVAGSTGSGKSIFLHSVILSLMYKCSPSQLRFIMIDPKRVEFTGYSGMPHMMLPNAVCECDKAINALGWAVKEMDRRFKKLQQYQVQNIQDFNHCKAVTETHEEEPMAYLVIVIDELNDLMMVGKKEVEEKITRLAQLGRASGIHMIIATQRPSADVITGTIKNNLPTRVAFSLGSSIDSRVILDETGAEKLLGAGDMLLSAQDSNTTIRLQGGFMSMEEVRKVVEYIKDHNDSYFDKELEKEILSDKNEGNTGSSDGNGNYDPNAPDLDELLPAALKLCIETGGASINMVQRRFRVGYARAARIIDQMELAGYISAGNGSKLRTVHMSMSEFKEKFGEDL